MEEKRASEEGLIKKIKDKRGLINGVSGEDGA